ncbi:MAG: putative DNA binding domain-containing protein [Hyphomicrobiales bacterium]
MKPAGAAPRPTPQDASRAAPLDGRGDAMIRQVWRPGIRLPAPGARTLSDYTPVGYHLAMLTRAKLLQRAAGALRESKYLDFKSEFAIESAESWCELIKDIAAFANSGGGIILFGVSNDGTRCQIDSRRILSIDTADVINKFRKYTDYELSGFEIVEVERAATRLPAFLIAQADIPIIFTKPGTYEVEPGRQKTAFAKGTVYFRHGAKSEPGNREDFIGWRDREVERVRRTWLGGIRKVVETPAGHAISVVSSPPGPGPKSTSLRDSGLSITAQLTADPGAIKVIPQNAAEIWPYRQKDLIREVNKRVSPRINGHDITCINSELDLLKTHPEFVYKSHEFATSQYSDAFVEWLADEFKKDKTFFARMRESYRRRRAQHRKRRDGASSR